MKKLNVNENCIGCGACVAIAPTCFEFTEEGLAASILDEIDNELLETALEALNSCPTSAIEISE